VCLLGRGGFGEVWKAIGPGGVEVALKFILLGDRAGQIEMHSLELMKNVRHAHLLALFGAWQRGGYLIIAMELGDRTLLQHWEGAHSQGFPGIPPAELLEYLREAAKGIDFLNQRHHPTENGELVSIQHKDIKPQNLLLVGGTVKVGDFGLARVLESTLTSASGGMTPAYAPPEVINGQATRWSDQYSLAVTYCQLRGGRLPFEGNAAQVVGGHLGRPPDLTMLPEAERAVVARALAKKPEERWPSCREFAEAIPAGTPVRGTRGRWRRRVAMTASVLALALLAPLVLFGLRRDEPGSPDGGPATLEARSAENQSPNPLPGEESSAAGVLQVLPIPAIQVDAGKAVVFEVRVRREGCRGAVRVEVGGGPVGIRARPVSLAADQDAARVELTAAEDTEETKGTVRVLARLGALQAEQNVPFVVLVRPALFLLPVGDLTLQPGESRTVAVRVKRRKCPGPIELRLDPLPNGVKSWYGLVPAGRDVGHVELAAVGSAAETTRTVPLLAVAAEVRTDRELRLVVSRSRTPAQRLAADTEAIRLRPNDPAGYLNRGHSYRAVSEYDKAIADFTECIRLEPDSPLGYNGRGLAYASRKDYARAIGDQDEAIRLDPKYARAFNNRGSVHRQTGNLEKAQADFTEAIRLDPQFALAFENRGRLAQARKEYDKALADFSTAIRLDPGNGSAFVNRGNAWLDKKEYDKAIADYDEAIRLNPKNAVAFYDRGLAWTRKEEYDKALTDFSAAIRLDPDYARAFNRRGLLWKQKKEYDKALADLNSAIRLDPGNAFAFANRGNIWLDRKEYDKAIEDYTRAIRLDPNYTWALERRGLLWNQKKEYDKAITDYDEAIRLNPKDATGFFKRGNAWKEKKEYDKAIEDYTQAIRLDPNYTWAFLNRGLLWKEKKDFDKAIADFTSCIRLDPKSAQGFFHRGSCWKERKEYDKAVEDYTQAIRFDSRSAFSFAYRGSCWKEKKEYDKAITDYDEAIRLEPKYAAAFFDRGNAWVQKKEYDKALADFSSAIRLDPASTRAFVNRGLLWQQKKEYDKALADFSSAIRLDPRDARTWAHRSAVYRLKGDTARAEADRKKASNLDPSLAK
jgi:tetratricopeptide (TPR) repeat protein